MPRNLHCLFIALAALVLALSCKSPQRDRNGILSEEAMVDVLYDYQLAVALARENAQGDSVGILEYKYTQAAFAKHHISSADFDLSLGHYARNGKTMLDITKAVEERFATELNAANAALEASRRDAFAQQTDTIVGWSCPEGVMLHAASANSFVAHVDPAKVNGYDELYFHFNTTWVYREGSRQAAATIAVAYEGDSTAVAMQTVRDGNYLQGVRISLARGRRVKALTLRVDLLTTWHNYAQYLFLNDVALWCIKNRKDD